jgi:hypothetical protein
MSRIAVAHKIRHRISSASLFKRLSVESFDIFIIVDFFDGQATSPACH